MMLWRQWIISKQSFVMLGSKVLCVPSNDLNTQSVFTRLGGDSIAFIRVIGLLRRTSPTVFLQYPGQFAHLADIRPNNFVGLSCPTMLTISEVPALLPAGLQRTQAVIDELDGDDVERLTSRRPSQDALLAPSLENSISLPRLCIPLSDVPTKDVGRCPNSLD